jgi:hypothetical protein
MAFPGSTYAPPGVYTQTLFENPIAGQIDLLRIPVFIGEGSELIPQSNLEVIRGSSSSVDQQVYLEDETGRAVTNVLDDGTITLGSFDGVITKLQVRNYPIVNGKGSGTTTNDRSAVQVRINNQPIVVRSVSGSNGVIELAQAPKSGDLVQVTYFFNRTDTLITDNVSSQVTDEQAQVYAQSGISDVSVGGTETFNIIEDSNDTLVLVVDGITHTIVIPEIGSGYTVQNMITLINSALSATSLVASAFTNNQGKKAILLSADQEIAVGLGTANGTIGFIGGFVTSRTKVFYTHQGPIVDGSNGGVTTTDTSHVTVLVDGVQVIPTSVNGQTRAVTLPIAPKQGSVVTIAYYFNTWQDTFDYLANINISEITQCGRTANQNDFIDGADFILKDDKIVWGTSALVSTGTQSGSVAFGESQVSLTLIDNQIFMAECSTVFASGSTSSTKFRLPYQPTSGNGRNSPLGSSLFQTVTNGRIDLPTDRPDLVKAYWGFNVQDALERGEISVISVDSATSVIELSEQVPVGAKVFATFYYNTLTDSEYVLTNETQGASGFGEYSVTKNGVDFFSALFDVSSKSGGLSTITLQFPSGSELKSDARIENGNPVEETVTVEFASTEASPAKLTVANSAPYYFVENKSATAQLKIDGGSALVIDLADSHATGFGHSASLVGNEIVYDADSGSTTVDVDSTNRDLSINVDGVVISASVETGAKSAVDFASALNEQAHGVYVGLTGGSRSTAILASGSEIDDYYIGFEVVITSIAANGSAAQNVKATVSDYDAGTKTLTFSDNITANALDVLAGADSIYLYNPETLPMFKGSSQFLGSVKLGATGEKYTDITFDYNGTSGSVSATITISDGTYASASALATEINDRIVAQGTFASESSTGTVFNKPMITAFADSSGRIGFKFRKGTADTGGGAFAFEKQGAEHDDFCLLAGIDASALGYGGDSVHIIHAPIATFFSAGGTKDLYDRLILRNRIFCGDFSATAIGTTPHNALSQCKLEVLSGTANPLCGLSVGAYGSASAGAVVQSATLVGNIGNANQLQSGGLTTQGEAYVTFYDGTGTKAQNNIFRMTIDGVFVETAFTASASGTVATIGSGNAHGSELASTVINQIKTAIASATSAFGTANSATMAKAVRREGFGIRISSAKTDSKSKIVIGDGSANSVLGFTDGAVSLSSPTSASELASVLMNDVATFADLLFGQGSDYQANGVSNTASDFPSGAIAFVSEDSSGQEYLSIQSKSTGSTSSVVIESATANDWLSYGTMIGAVDGDSSFGEDSIDGFFVISNNSDGSGTANDSVFNDGTGSDGVVGQTYVDSVTGLTFTILPRVGGGTYPSGETFAITSSKTFVCDANYPVMLNGVEMVVSNTLGVAVGDTSVVEAFEKGGEQPTIGEPYVVSYLYQKESFQTQLFTKMSAIEQAFGEISPENPLSLASYLAILNGSVLVALKQVQKEGGSQASVESYRNAFDEVEGKIAGQVDPSVIVPLRTDSADLLQYLSRHISVQSSIRYRAERTAIVGASAGTDVNTAINLAKSISNTRFRMVYPDSAIVPVTNSIGETREYLVDGAYLASALVGNRVSPNRDVATPWTNAQLVGFSQLGRKLDAVEQNQVSVNGVTVLADQVPFVKVRHGLTTDMTNVLTKTPTIIQIADEVQKQSRAVLERFIGVKFLPGVLSQVEGRMSQMFIGLVNGQIITGYTGISASVSADDPTVAEVEAYYSPVFPLLYLVVTFNLRSNI